MILSRVIARVKAQNAGSPTGVEATRATNIRDFESQFESAIRHTGPRLIEVVL